MNRITIGIGAIMLAVGASPVAAQGLSLAPVFSEHMILQRNQAIPIEGEAAPAAQVSVKLGAAAVISSVADKDGRWRVELPARLSGESLVLEVKSGTETIRLANLAIGDVFLCSGQSNMEFPLRIATNADSAIASSSNPKLRLFNVPRRSSASPQSSFAQPVEWQISSPQTTPGFSAACYFMGQELQHRRQVPVGLIAASWGGSIIQDWLSAEAAKANGGYEDGLALLALHSVDTVAAEQTLTDQAQAYLGRALGQLSEPIPADVENIWEAWGAGLDGFDGSGLYSSSFAVTAEQADQGGQIVLGPIDDMDVTLVNGRWAGTQVGWNVPRVYRLPPGMLKAGNNRVEVQVIDTGGGGGMYGPQDRRIELDDDSVIPLNGDWVFQRGASIGEAGQPPLVPWIGGAGLTTLYNGMIAPLGRIPLAGIAWYQGEANVADAEGYKRLLRSLIADWRTRFTTRRFTLVQLANFGPLASAPGESDWAELRDAQRAVVAADSDTGMAIAIDVGDPYDIHPANKISVGHRLADAMEGTDKAQLPEASLVDGALAMTFDRDLRVIGGARPIGFELCAPDACRFVSAQFDGARTVKVPIMASDNTIRYLWADSPIANLFDRDGVPVSPFTMAIPR